MFQSDDFDDNLSNENFTEVDKNTFKIITKLKSNNSDNSSTTKNETIKYLSCTPVTKIIDYTVGRCEKRLGQINENPNRVKRKRKFPGPAGLLPDTSHEASHIILGNSIQSSQSFCSQNQLPSSIFEDAPWLGMKQDLSDLKYVSTLSDPNLCTIDFVKMQAGSCKLTGRRVPLLAGVIQSIDHSLQDPSIVLRDETADIQCTLHRNAWELLKCYLVSQSTVMLLQNTTVLTTGTAMKKNYLNITLNNIIAIYCDDNSSYTESDKVLKVDTESNLNGRYSMESYQFTDAKITILRNVSSKIGQKSTLKGTASAKDINDTEAAKNKLITESIFDGLNTDEFFDDFD